MNMFDYKNCKILIVDDIAQNIQILQHILKIKDYQISFSMNGKQALEMVKTTTYDLILLDIMMPEMSGFDVCNALKNDDATKDLPIIFISAQNDIDSIVKGFKLGAVDYITKPFNSSELLARVKTHLELKHAREALQELNATKDKFFSIIAHDLRNPFNSIIGFSSLLLSNYDLYDKERVIKFIQRIHNSGESIFKLLENLLQWSRIQTNRMEFTPETINLKQLVDATLSVVTNNAEAKQINLTNLILEDIMIVVDSNMISTVIRNLVSNAIKFTHENGQITISSKLLNDHVEVTISDTGVGMPDDDLKKLFRIDTQFTVPGTANEKGSGLGLILCKEFIEKNNGIIWAESSLGKGSDFKFTLPLKK